VSERLLCSYPRWFDLIVEPQVTGREEYLLLVSTNRSVL